MVAPIESGTIDVHTHAIPPSLPDLAERFAGSWVGVDTADPCAATITRGGRVFRSIDARCWDAEARLEAMDEDGVGLQVVSPVPVTFSYENDAVGAGFLARAQNEWIAELVRAHPTRFRGFATLPLQDPVHAVEVAVEAIDSLGLSGVEVGTDVNGKDLDAVELDQLYAALHERQVPLFIHPRGTLARDRLGEHRLDYTIGMPSETAAAAARLFIGGVLDRHPGMEVILAHGGGSLPALAGRICRFLTIGSREGGSVTPRDLLRRFRYDGLVFEPSYLSWLVRQVGADRVLLGTDFPFPIADRPPERTLEETDLPPSDIAAICRTNASALLDRRREPRDDHDEEQNLA